MLHFFIYITYKVLILWEKDRSTRGRTLEAQEKTTTGTQLK